jgi:hypothetical protein
VCVGVVGCIVVVVVVVVGTGVVRVVLLFISCRLCICFYSV